VEGLSASNYGTILFSNTTANTYPFRYVLRQKFNAQYAHQVTLIAVCVSIDPLV
jgi:hypothetical protein